MQEMDRSRALVFQLVLDLQTAREEQLAEITRISKELGSFEPFGSFWYPFGSELSAYG
jgi:hypothetical protein